VGTGYSYVTSTGTYCTSDAQIGVDLVGLLKGFLTKFPQLATNDFWIFCESYGGKMAASFGVALDKAIKSGEIKVNFKGVALGDSWISPIDFVLTWADYLMVTSEIDANGYNSIQTAAKKTQASVIAKKWVQATNDWGNTENTVEQVSFGVNFYNILNRGGDFSSSSSNMSALQKSFQRHVRLSRGSKGMLDDEDKLNVLMNGPIKKKLQIPAGVTWGGQSGDVFYNLQGAFMQDTIAYVDYLLTAGYSVNVYSGNLDLICCTTGTNAWVNKLKWPDLKTWAAQPRQSFSAPGSEVIVGFTKSLKNFNFINVLAAGHMVPTDQPAAAKAMLDAIIAPAAN